MFNFYAGILFAHPFTVTIDAGHGGKDPGAIGSFAQEKNINLSVALKLGKLIQENCPDVRVVYTRKTDIFIPLEERAMIANNAHSNLFICIHTNSSPNPHVTGAETYALGLAKTKANMDVARRENSVILLENNYKEKYQGFNPNSIDSYIMFEYMQDKYIDRSIQFASDVENELTANANRSNRGVRQAGFWVLHQTSMPAVLIELGYITNEKEETYLTSNKGQNHLAESIFKAFLEFKHEYDRKTNNHFAASTEESAPSVVADTSNDNDTASQSQTIKVDTVKPQKEIKQEPTQAPKHEAPAQKPVATPQVTHSQTLVSQERKTQDAPIFKIQFLLSSKKLSLNNAQFRHLHNVSFYQEDHWYKYTAGDTSNYRQIIVEHQKIKKLFPTAFVIAFLNDHKIPLEEAIRLWRANQRK